MTTGRSLGRRGTLPPIALSIPSTGPSPSGWTTVSGTARRQSAMQGHGLRSVSQRCAAIRGNLRLSASGKS
jgi:hypothetical protein